MKKFLSVLLCLTMIFSLSACQEKEVTSYFTVASNLTNVVSQETTGSVDVSIETDGILQLIDVISYISSGKDIKDYSPSEIDEELKTNIEEIFTTIGSNKVSFSWNGKIAKDKSSQLNMIAKLGDKELYSGEAILKEDIVYISSEAILKAYLNIVNLTSEDSGISINVDEILNNENAFELESDYLKVVDLKETPNQLSEIQKELEITEEKDENSTESIDINKIIEMMTNNPEEYNKFIQSIAKPMDDLMVSFATPFVSENNGEYTVKVNIGTLKSDLETTWNNAKKNPKKLYDKINNFVNSATSTPLGNELYGKALAETKEKLANKKDLIKEWKDKDFATLYNDIKGEFDDKWFTILNGTFAESTISQKDNSFTNKYTAKVVINGKTLFSVNATSTIKATDLSTINVENLEDSITVDEFSQSISNLMFASMFDDYENYNNEDYNFEDEDFEITFDEDFEYDPEDVEIIFDEDEEDFEYDFNDEYSLDLKTFNVNDTELISIMKNFDFKDFKDIDEIEDKYKPEFRTISKKYVDGNVNTYSNDDYISLTNENDDYTKAISLSLAEEYTDVEIQFFFEAKDINKALSEFETVMKDIIGVEMDKEMKERIISEASDNKITEEYLYGSAESKDDEYSIDYGYAEYDDEFSLSVSLMKY